MTLTADKTDILDVDPALKSNGHHNGPNMNWLEFDLHGISAFRVEASSPISTMFQDLFRPFRAKGVSHFDLTISETFEPLIEAAIGEAHGESDFYYNDHGLYIEKPNVQIFIDETGIRLHGKGELLNMALPLIDRMMVQHGAAMLHAMTVDYKGKGILMPAWGGSGKTSTMSKLIKIPGYSFMGDDWTFLSLGSNLLGFAKPMFIKPYHRTLYPHLFTKVHKPLVPNALSKSLHSLTTRIHPWITRYPKLAALTRKWSPEHMMVQPEQAFPDSVISRGAPLAASLFVERFEGDSLEPQFYEKDARWMTTKLIGNFFSELPKPSRLVMTTLGASGLISLEQSFREKEEILLHALGGKPAFYLRVPRSFDPDKASDAIVDRIKYVVRAAGIE
ncbi:MAG TPA: hypothetical protein VN364_12435 [Bellilinea sp.]|nr:hypothetical protein [Bellilinea sp.]